MKPTKTDLSSQSKSARGRKAPRMTKVIKHWMDKFMPVLSKRHGTHAKRIFHRLMKKSSTLRSTLKRRSKEYEVLFKISLPTVRNMLLRHYSKPCLYCHNILDVSNIKISLYICSNAFCIEYSSN